MYWGSTKRILHYPSAVPVKTSLGRFHKGRDSDNMCKLGFEKVNTGKGLDGEQVKIFWINLFKETTRLPLI